MPHIHTDFYIMKAYHLTTSGRKLGLKKIIKDEPNCTILCVTREYGYGKSVNAFIIGAHDSSNYGVTRGDEATYTIDTGNGYKSNNESMIINYVIDVKDGKITNLDAGTVAAIDNAYTWVMK